jgi:AcrR family transcriptional regulator
VSRERGYRSELREQQAKETRRRIRAAARELFGKRGFASTTVADIARAAGVSAATVYVAYESKAGIVTAMLEELEEGVEIGPRLGAMFAEADPRRQLRLFAEAHCGLFESGGDVLRAMVRAVESAEVAALAERGDGHRREVIAELTRRWGRAGVLRRGLTASDAAERMWLLTTVEGFLAAVDRLGWTAERYRRWLGDLLEAEILEGAG